MGTCQFAMLLHTAVWLSTSAPFPLTDVCPGICVRARRGLHVGQPGPRDPPRRHREHVVSTARQGKKVRSQRRDLGAWWERHWWDSDRRSTLFATPSARVSPILSHLRNSKFGHKRCVLLQHPGSRCRSSEGPLTSSDRQSAPFLPSVQTAGYHGTENLAGKTNRPCCTGHDDAACLMPVLRHSFAAQLTALQRLRSGSQVTSGPPEALCGLGTAS